MSGQQMSEAPWAIDSTGGFYPVGALTPRFRQTLIREGRYTPPQGATHFTWDEESGAIVDWLREVAFKSSRGRPSEDPERDALYQDRPHSVEGERARYPGVGLYVRGVYEVIGQESP